MQAPKGRDPPEPAEQRQDHARQSDHELFQYGALALVAPFLPQQHEPYAHSKQPQPDRPERGAADGEVKQDESHAERNLPSQQQSPRARLVTENAPNHSGDRSREPQPDRQPQQRSRRRRNAGRKGKSHDRKKGGDRHDDAQPETAAALSSVTIAAAAVAARTCWNRHP